MLLLISLWALLQPIYAYQLVMMMLISFSSFPFGNPFLFVVRHCVPRGLFHAGVPAFPKLLVSITSGKPCNILNNTTNCKRAFLHTAPQEATPAIPCRAFSKKKQMVVLHCVGSYLRKTEHRVLRYEILVWQNRERIHCLLTTCSFWQMFSCKRKRSNAFQFFVPPKPRISVI